ncbi:MAG: glycosyltransferase family 4 protein [Anaerolineales bacterium]|nr:glycosyltransferase family 4 protein [Anaerolineales bacterium]
MNLLMLSGDTSVVLGERRAFYNTLSEFSNYWGRIDILTHRVPGVECHACFDNVTFYPSPWGKVMQPFYVWKKGNALVSRRRYDLIVSHDYGYFLHGTGARWLSQSTGVPHVSEIHHVDGYPRAANLRECLQPWLTRWFVRGAMSGSLGFRITNEGELGPLMRSWGVPAEQLFLLYSLYLDFGVFRPEGTSIEYDAIFVGRLTANKAPSLFLDAIAAASRKRDGLRVLIIGAGPLKARLRTRAAGLGSATRVEFRDWVAAPGELADLYRRARCLICASFSEGGPRVVAEALACGVPVISTRVGLARELVQDGVTGFLVDWSADDIAERIEQIVSDPDLRARMALAAPLSVQRFEKSRVLREYAMGYQELVKIDS